MGSAQFPPPAGSAGATGATGAAGASANIFTAVKIVDTQRASTTTIVSDPELFINGLAVGTYNVRATLSGYSIGNTSSPAMRFAYSGTLNSSQILVGVNSNASNGVGAGSLSAVQFFTCAAGVQQMYIWSGYMTLGTAGNLAFQWAQSASSASNDVIMAGSSLTVVKVA